MDMILRRTICSEKGVISEISSADGIFQAVGMEHGYPVDGGWAPKVAGGTYTCVRHPPNRLPYETFMLENVPDFQGVPVSGILVHILNFDSESQGCIGVGEDLVTLPSGLLMITKSTATFKKFMALQTGVDKFRLIILSS